MIQKLTSTLFAIFVFTLLFNASTQAQVQVELAEDGTLSILGDANPNDIFIWVQEELTVSASGVLYTYDTLDVTFVSIKLGRGGDLLGNEVDFFIDAPLLADVEIQGGSGLDFVQMFSGGLGFGYLDGNLKINSGRGRDFLYFDDITVTGNVEIETGQGQDTVDFDANLFPLAPPNNQIFGNLSINTGADDDRVIFDKFGETTFVGGDLVVKLGQRNDSISGNADVDGSAYLSGGQGDDSSLFLSIIDSDVTKIGFED